MNSLIMKHWRSILVVAVVTLCGLSLWISDYLLSIHAPAKTATLEGARKDSIWAGICGPEDEDGAGCEDVITSDYGYVSIPWRTTEVKTEKDAAGKTVQKRVVKWEKYSLPVIQLGMCYYIFMGVWFVFTGLPSRAMHWWHLLPMVLAIGAACASIFYIFVMAFKLDQWCRLCLILHFIDFSLLAAVILLWPKEIKVAGKSKKDRARLPAEPPGLSFRHVLATLACVASVCALIIVHYHDQRALADVSNTIAHYERELADIRKDVQKDPLYLLKAYRRIRQVDIPPRQSQSSIGNPQAKHEVVIFSDFQCSHCRKFADRFKKKFMPLWKGQIKLTFRHFPLCTHCNRSQRSTRKHPYGMHPNACDAAYAVEAARIQGGQQAFWKMHDLILANQKALKAANFDKSRFEQFAQQIGLDVQRFLMDMESNMVRQAIMEDVELGIRLKIKSTPTVFLDGRLLTLKMRNDPAFWKAVAAHHVGPK